MFFVFSISCFSIQIKIHEYFHKSPFPCNCVRELWVMVIRLTDFREEIGLSDVCYMYNEKTI